MAKKKVEKKPKKNTGTKRKKTDISQNITYSLALQRKNAEANGVSLFQEVASNMASMTASAVKSYVWKPLRTYVQQTYLPVSESTSTAVVTEILKHTPLKSSKTLSIEEIKQRQAETERPFKEFRSELTSRHKAITKLLNEKKQIDSEEKALREAAKGGKSVKLSTSKAQRRLDILKRIDGLLLEKIDLQKDLIIEHARRRVELMFLLMITIYKQDVSVTRGPTNRQHGSGSKDEGTNGCHSSLLPNPVFKKNESSSNYSVSSLLGTVSGFMFSKPQAAKSQSSDDDLLKFRYLRDALNATVELDRLVNDFDCKMEGTWQQSPCVKTTLQILNSVSKGKINPIEGMNKYGKVQASFFNSIFYKHQVEINYSDLLDDDEAASEEYYPHADVLYPMAFRQVCRYEYMGTFELYDLRMQALREDLSNEHTKAWLKPDFYEMFLRIKGGAQTYTKRYLPEVLDTASSYVISDKIEQRILAMQQEIYDASSEFDKPKSKNIADSDSSDSMDSESDESSHKVAI